jgi:hypothetical protein
MEALREALLNYTDERLLDVYRTQRDEYTPEAVKVFEEEISKRGLDPNARTAAEASERKEAAKAAAEASVANLSRDDFDPIGPPFTKIDLLTADAVLRNSKVPYFIKESEGAPGLFTVFVYKDSLETARDLISEHFEISADGQYILSQSDILDRLKSFSLYDIRISDAAAHEQLEVGFSESERSALIKLTETLISEADAIESEQGRVVFFYDTLEDLAAKLKKDSPLTRTDFLAIIELCQIYCDDSRYDQELNHTVSSILSFFLE